MDVHAILEQIKSGELKIADAEVLLKNLAYEDVGFAKIDHHRQLRTGFAEVIFSQGKTESQVAEIFLKLSQKGSNVLASRATVAQYEATKSLVPKAVYDSAARTITLDTGKLNPIGLVSVCTGGTADIPVAMEAVRTAEIFGAKVQTFFDVGVAGIHRLLNNVELIGSANIIVAVAGMEGALPSVLAGLVDKPVIAVPTSVGYGASFGGLASLLTMLNSCASGIATVNIDNGFGAGYLCAQINRQIETAKLS